MSGQQVLAYLDWYRASARETRRRDQRERIEKRLGIGLGVIAVLGFLVAADATSLVFPQMIVLFAFVAGMFFFGPPVMSHVYRLFDPATPPLPLSGELGEYGKYVGGTVLLTVVGPFVWWLLLVVLSCC
jgi:hypothetical protein